jgi:hypothetical protein
MKLAVMLLCIGAMGVLDLCGEPHVGIGLGVGVFLLGVIRC